MIRAVIVMNTQGKPRITKFYEYQPVEKQQELIRDIYGVLCSRAENVSNFIEADGIFGPDTKLVYKHYATLYFVFVFDSSENELGILDLIQEPRLGLKQFGVLIRFDQNSVRVPFCGGCFESTVFVETLDKCFKNVCELDIIFNFNKLHTVLDEIIMGGQVVETNSNEVIKAVQEILKLERSSESTSLVAKATGRQGR